MASTQLAPKPMRMFSQPLQGIADRAIAHGQPGRVKFRGTYWAAKLYPPDQQICIAPGEPVTVVAIDRITLVVRPSRDYSNS